MMSFSGAEFFRPRAAVVLGAACWPWEVGRSFGYTRSGFWGKKERAPAPRHIGIILDGNRRHGERSGVRDPQAIYTLGAQKLDDLLDWCADLGVPAVTLWGFSPH